MNDEIASGLRNAMEHNASLDEAVQSFINAGYNPVEVKEAAKSMAEGATTLLHSDSIPLPASLTTSPQSNTLIQVHQQPTSLIVHSKNKMATGRKIILVVLFIILIMLVGAIASVVIYGDELVAWLAS